MRKHFCNLRVNIYTFYLNTKVHLINEEHDVVNSVLRLCECF